MKSRTASEVFSVFLRLGLTSFGGPIAHLGFFHRELVERRQWVSESQYAQLLALCQFLPGPASSQLGFALGLLRANWSGAIAAFLAFTARPEISGIRLAVMTRPLAPDGARHSRVVSWAGSATTAQSVPFWSAQSPRPPAASWPPRPPHWPCPPAG